MVTYVGTLTENEMIFRVCSVGGVVYEDAMNGQLRQELINKAVKLQKSNSHQDFNLLYEEKLVSPKKINQNSLFLRRK